MNEIHKIPLLQKKKKSREFIPSGPLTGIWVGANILAAAESWGGGKRGWAVGQKDNEFLFDLPARHFSNTGTDTRDRSDTY